MTREVLNRPDLTDREDLATNPLRVANRAETDRVISDETHRWTTVTLPPVTFRDVELPMGAVPALGGDAVALLSELGFDDAATTALSANVVIGRVRPHPSSD